MTRKDYEKIAQTIKDTLKDVALEVSPRYQQSEVWGIQRVMEKLCDTLKEDNPNFRRDTFMRACGF